MNKSPVRQHFALILSTLRSGSVPRLSQKRTERKSAVGFAATYDVGQIVRDLIRLVPNTEEAEWYEVLEGELDLTPSALTDLQLTSRFSTPGALESIRRYRIPREVLEMGHLVFGSEDAWPKAIDNYICAVDLTREFSPGNETPSKIAEQRLGSTSRAGGRVIRGSKSRSVGEQS